MSNELKCSLPQSSNESVASIVSSIIEALTQDGLAVTPGFFDPDLVRNLALDAIRLRREGAFHRAGVGINREASGRVRGDDILWFEPGELTAAQALAWSVFENLRLELNRELFLGLRSFEAHYAIYPPGGIYQKHIDRFRDDDSRVVSLVAYLNENWLESDGGQLLIFDGASVKRRVQPNGGTSVCFMSATTPHEVVPSVSRDRISIAVWFKR